MPIIGPVRTTQRRFGRREARQASRGRSGLGRTGRRPVRRIAMASRIAPRRAAFRGRIGNR